MKSLEEIFLSTQKVQHGSVKCSDAERYVHALLDLSNEHSQAIYHLHKVKLYGSAFALLRSCFECYIRGIWLRDCATDSQKELVAMKDGKWPTIANIIKEVDSQCEQPFFEPKYKKLLGSLSSLTHGLSTQASMRLRQKLLAIEPTQEELTFLLQEICLFAILSNLAIAEIIENQENILNFTNMFEELVEIMKLNNYKRA